MAHDDGFDLISVGSDDDEVVIQAGAKSGRAYSRAPEPEPAMDTVADTEDGAPASPSQDSSQGSSDGEDSLEGLTEEERLEYAKRMARKRKREEEAMATTQSDLHAKGPFTGMHTALVVLGIVIVVAILAWYFTVYAA